MLKRKRFLSLFFTIVLACGLMLGAAGCSGSSSEEEEDSSSEDASADEEEEADASADAGELTTFRWAVTSATTDQYMSIIGLSEGIFEEYGLDVEVTEFGSGSNTVDAVLLGEADIGVHSDYALINRISSTVDTTEIKVVGRFATNISGAHFYVNSDTITDLSDLAGKKIATMPGTIWEFWTSKTLELAGLTEDDVELVEVDSAATAITAMSTGDADAYWGTGATASKLDEAGYTRLVELADIDLTTDFYFIVAEGYDEELLTAFFEALNDVQAWMAENPEEAASIIADEIGTDADDLQAILECYELTIDFTQGTLDLLYEIKDWALENDVIETDFEFENYLDLSVLESLYPENVEVEWE